LILKADFVPYLGEILPTILATATLKPEMGIAGKGKGELEDVLSEIKPESSGRK